MRNDPLYDGWREMAWRRRLSAQEEARMAEWLSAHPEAQADWDSEMALNELLTALPDAPLASNFTARAVEMAEREAAGGRRNERPAWRKIPWWRRWTPRAAVAAAVVVGAITYSHIQSVERLERAQSVATVSQVASLPTPDVLNDFDAIALSSTPPADEELIKLMQ